MNWLHNHLVPLDSVYPEDLSSIPEKRLTLFVCLRMVYVQNGVCVFSPRGGMVYVSFPQGDTGLVCVCVQEGTQVFVMSCLCL